MRLVLPLPPSVNRYWRSVCIKGRPRLLLSKEGRAFKRHAATVAELQGAAPLEGEVAVAMRFYMARKGSDVDNRVKPCLDVLQGVAYANDRQVAKIEAARDLDRDDPRVEVEVTALEDAA